MSADVRCGRCGSYRRRSSDPFHWNEESVAGLVIGYLCPDCQTSEEHIEAEVNVTLSPPSEHRAVKVEGREGLVKLIYALIASYPTPDVLRAKADKLAKARTDEQATEMVRLMRSLADRMESGELYEDEQ